MRLSFELPWIPGVPEITCIKADYPEIDCNGLTTGGPLPETLLKELFWFCPLGAFEAALDLLKL
jgi:hypothetical protein